MSTEPLWNVPSERPTRELGGIMLPKAFVAWIRSADAYDVLDDAVMGCLEGVVVDEVCEDYGISLKQFTVALDAVLREGL